MRFPSRLHFGLDESAKEGIKSIRLQTLVVGRGTAAPCGLPCPGKVTCRVLEPFSAAGERGNPMSVAFLILGILPGLTVLVLGLGLARTLAQWNKAKAAPAMLFPAAAKPRPAHLLLDILIFKGPLAGDKPLWAGTVLFHASLLLILIGHIRVFTDFPRLWQALGLDQTTVDALAGAIGATLGAVCIASGLFLLLRRILLRRVREISGPTDYAAIGLVLIVALTGQLMRLGPPFDLAAVRAYVAAGGPWGQAPAPSDPLFLLHALLAQIGLMSLAFGKFLHIPGIFYSKSLLYRQ